jgi:hypothetical protein
MVRAMFKKEEQNTSYPQETYLRPQKNSNEKDILKLLEKLEADKACLSEQKERFSSLLMQLELRGKEEVENRKRVIEELNLEVSDLKYKCEKLSIVINSESTVECKQAGV